jgi:glycosyltransferase involved in cell wall biosynthesis
VNRPVRLKLGVLLAHGFPVPAPFVIGYSHLLQTIMTGAGNQTFPVQIDSAGVLFVQDFPIDFARNRVCKLFLDESQDDYLLFLDADMRHPPDLAHRLLAHREALVTARYVVRKPPFYSVAMRKTGDGPTDYKAIEKVEPHVEGLVPIDAGGAGALLIHRDVLTTIRVRIGDDWFRYQDGPDGLRSRSEDMWFYEQAKAAGFQPYLDADLNCTHVANFEVDHRDYKAMVKQFPKETEVTA